MSVADASARKYQADFSGHERTLASTTSTEAAPQARSQFGDEKRSQQAHPGAIGWQPVVQIATDSCLDRRRLWPHVGYCAWHMWNRCLRGALVKMPFMGHSVRCSDMTHELGYHCQSHRATYDFVFVRALVATFTAVLWALCGVRHYVSMHVCFRICSTRFFTASIWSLRP